MISIAPYTPVYWEAIQAVHDPARMQELEAAGLEGAFLPLSVAAFREDLFDYQLYVALYGEQVAGFVAFTPEELAWLYVRPDCQGRGIGRALASYALAHMESGQKTVEVLAGNHRARNLYHSLGFTQEELIHGKMPGNETFAVSVWQMTKA